MTGKELTGRKVFFIIASAFALIIGVNLTLAYKAVSTFPGLETKNSYVASQKFEADKVSQLRLGWQVQGALQGDTLVLEITDKAGNPVQVSELSGTLGRATHVAEDQTPEFEFDGTAYVAPVTAGAGNWNFRMVALAVDGTKFRQRVVIYVRPEG